MPTVTGPGVKAAREEQSLSQRALARRVAERLGDPDRATALGVLLSRLERRGSSDLDGELAHALAEELAVAVGDLEEGVLFTWVRGEGEHRTFPALGLRQLLWTSREAAYDARDFMAVGSQPFENFDLNIARGSVLVPVFRQTVRRTMEQHFGELQEHELARLFVVDPSEKAFRELVTAQVALAAENAADRRGVGQAWGQGAAEGILETAGPDELFYLVARRAARMRSGEPALAETSPELRAEWEREHAALADAALAYLADRYDVLKRAIDDAARGGGAKDE